MTCGCGHSSAETPEALSLLPSSLSVEPARTLVDTTVKVQTVEKIVCFLAGIEKIRNIHSFSFWKAQFPSCLRESAAGLVASWYPRLHRAKAEGCRDVCGPMGRRQVAAWGAGTWPGDGGAVPCWAVSHLPASAHLELLPSFPWPRPDHRPSLTASGTPQESWLMSRARCSVL